MRFQWVSPAGRSDPQARWREGRTDCVCLAAVLAAELGRLGLTTRIESGRILGVLDAQHTWVAVCDEDGVWKRFDPLLQVHCWRLWGPDQPYGTLFRGAITNALIGWPGPGAAVVTGQAGKLLDVEHQFLARRVAEMKFTELVAAVLGRDISAHSPQAALTDIGITSKELVILLASMEHDLGCVIDFDVLAGLSTIASFERVLESSGQRTL